MSALSDAVAKKVVKQIDFYFSDNNLPRDAFLRGKVSENAEGWVDLAIIMSFARMKKLTSNKEGVVEALRASSKVVNVDEAGERIKRKEPLPESVDFSDRTVYAKGFPQSVSNVDDIEEVFTPFGTVGRVHMRRYRSKDFKGSVFVEFSKPEEAAAAVKAGPSGIKFRGQNLVKVMMKNDYFSEKSAARKAARDAEEADAPKFQGLTRTPGALLKFTGIAATANVLALKTLIQEHGDLKYLEMDAGADNAIGRFASAEEAAKVVAELAKEGSTLAKSIKTATALEGDEEKAYWDKVEASHRRKFDMRHKKGKKKGRNDRQRQPKRERDGDDAAADSNEGSGSAKAARVAVAADASSSSKAE